MWGAGRIRTREKPLKQRAKSISLLALFLLPGHFPTDSVRLSSDKETGVGFTNPE